MASSSESGSGVLEFRVGLFVLIGLALIGYMIIQFGRFGVGLKNTYPLIVELPNASGLLNNSKVLMSGAQIGSVTQEPRVLEHARGVAVRVAINAEQKIYRNYKIVVGSSGLLGDRYIDVLPAATDEGGSYAAGEIVHGTRAPGGMEELTEKGSRLVDDLRKAVANLDGTITRVNQDLLKPELFQNLQVSVANLNATTKNFQAASEKLGGVIDDAHGVVGKASGAMDGAKDTLATADKAAEDVRKAFGDARKVLGSVNKATDEAVHGKGLIATLISNPELSNNLTSLISNLRRSGVLFYKDRPAPTPEPEEKVEGRRQKAEGGR